MAMKKKVFIILAIIITASMVSYKIWMESPSYKMVLERRGAGSSPSDNGITVNSSPESTKTTKCTSESTVEYFTYKQTDPLWKENNKFGLYIYAEESKMFDIAKKLVNSNGGQWGYVLIPFNVKDRDSTKWSRVFTQLVEKKLIPIIQLWDVDTSSFKEQTKGAAEFLNGFLWPIKYRYISVYNETNDSKFWYGKVDPEEYAEILDYTIKAFKSKNQDFFMMNGALNVTAGTDGLNMDAFLYMKKMNEKVDGIFEKLDGWASHPYPQPNFAGSPKTEGRWGIRAYDDELKFLKDELGVKKDLPVFITETGWAHAEGENYNASYLPVKTVAEYFKTAYKDYWLKDDRVRAVIPFTVRYDAPFDHFSWVNADNVPYYHYDVIKDMEKVKGEPPSLEKSLMKVDNCE